jgi:nucleoside 2-deoxyribosyltransferase
MPNNLINARCYLAGPIDYADDDGKGWRRDMHRFLGFMGVTVLDPTHKQILTASSEAAINEDKELVERLRANEDWEGLAKFMKEIRCLDLRMVDISDFIIAYIDPDVQMCGTWEEIFTSNRQKKPILLVVKGGKHRLSGWMFGTLPVEYLFDSFEDAKSYLECINDGLIVMDNRWTLLDHELIANEQIA